jgi:DNA/RNA-binding domain of Phe-tRNA-synthetase-like protein
MYFQHTETIWSEHPGLVAVAIGATGITPGADVGAAVAGFVAAAHARLAGGTESDLPEIKAWRQTFAKMGLKPTQYRCASESLLRRLRKEGSAPRIHPLIDLCNAISMAYAIPVAVLDTSRIVESLQVRHAEGTERYLTFGGETEHPEPGEVSFVDAAGNAHARRWTNRQSGLSAVRDATSEVLIVAEAMHAGGAADIAKLVASVQESLRTVWGVPAQAQLLSSGRPRFDFA